MAGTPKDESPFDALVFAAECCRYAYVSDLDILGALEWMAKVRTVSAEAVILLVVIGRRAGLTQAAMATALDVDRDVLDGAFAEDIYPKEERDA